MSPKKPKATRHKNKQGHPARAAGNQNVVSIDAHRVRSSPNGETIFPIFTRWMEENHIPADIGDPLPVLSAFIDSYKKADATGDLTRLREPALSATLRLNLELLGEEATAQLLYTLLIYLRFLNDLGLWGGSEEQLINAVMMLENLLGLDEESGVADEQILVPALSTAQALEALSALALAERVRSFMQWFGQKRKVTANGMLTRVDIKGAAASLGISAVGVASGASALPPLVGEIQRATRAQDVPRLDIYWEALIAVGAIELNSTSARLVYSLEIFTDPQYTEARILLLRDVAQAMYERFGTSRFIEAGRDQGMPYELIAELLLDACSDPGFPVADLLRFGQDPDAEIAAPYAAARLALERLADEGLLDITENYKVPAALIKPAAFIVGYELEVPVIYQDPSDEEPSYVGFEDAPVDSIDLT